MNRGEGRIEKSGKGKKVVKGRRCRYNRIEEKE